MKFIKEMGVILIDLILYILYDIWILCIFIVLGEVKGFWFEMFMIIVRILEDGKEMIFFIIFSRLYIWFI